MTVPSLPCSARNRFSIGMIHRRPKRIKTIRITPLFLNSQGTRLLLAFIQKHDTFIVTTSGIIWWKLTGASKFITIHGAENGFAPAAPQNI